MGSNGLQLTWIPVIDERGRTRMEAVWTESAPVALPAGAAAA